MASEFIGGRKSDYLKGKLEGACRENKKGAGEICSAREVLASQA